LVASEAITAVREAEEEAGQAPFGTKAAAVIDEQPVSWLYS
jgi:hypothetical protein